MHLTDLKIRTSTPRDSAYKVFDGGGLYLSITPNGSKLWRQKYRFGGKEKTLSFGPFPLISLKDARLKREGAKRLLAEGIDPSVVKRSHKFSQLTASENTFGKFAGEYLKKSKSDGLAEVTVEKKTWLLGLVSSDLNHRSIDEITSRDALAAIRKVEERGNHETARRLKSTIGGVFRYAIATGCADTDPTYALRDALIRPTVKSHAAITDKAKFGELLRAMEGYEGHPQVRLGLKLQALLVPRPGELRHAQFSEFDLTDSVWRVPAERMKRRIEHRVPLPASAIAILEELGTYFGPKGFILPSVNSTRRPISENTFNATLRRLGFSKDEMTSHGFRSTFSTIANEASLWNPDAIERALAHVDANQVRRAYSRGQFWDERVRLASWWSDRLDEMRASLPEIR